MCKDGGGGGAAGLVDNEMSTMKSCSRFDSFSRSEYSGFDRGEQNGEKIEQDKVLEREENSKGKDTVKSVGIYVDPPTSDPP